MVCIGPPNTDTSKIETVASAAIVAAIAAPDAFFRLNFSEDCDTPLMTFNPAPINAPATSRVGMSTRSNITTITHL